MWQSNQQNQARSLNRRETQQAVEFIKETFGSLLGKTLNLTRVTAPLFVDAQSGLNDDLSGVEKPVSFRAPGLDDAELQVVQSLAKWKRQALKEYGFGLGEGIYADMRAIRKDEALDSTHSLMVDQWDWEKVIASEDRNKETLHRHVSHIYQALRDTQRLLQQRYPEFGVQLPPEIFFVSSQELEQQHPQLTPEQREHMAAQEHGAVFVSEIGGPLASGTPHDTRAPDYDDWNLNGDILIWNPVLETALEISSMGIRVNARAMQKQLELAGCQHRATLPFHRAVLNGDLPYTVGGGIGQSRVCMYLLGKRHIGEVQVGVWPRDQYWEQML